MTDHMSTDVSPARWIRETVFGFYSQSAYASAIGKTQATISRWETGKSPIDQTAVLALARERKIAFDANWFHAVPQGRIRLRRVA